MGCAKRDGLNYSELYTYHNPATANNPATAHSPEPLNYSKHSKIHKT